MTANGGVSHAAHTEGREALRLSISKETAR
jgi:hypothetical protein